MTRKTTINVGVIDDHALVRAGLRMLFSSNPDIRLVGEAADRMEAFALLDNEQKEPFDVWLVDIQLGQGSALDFVEQLIAKSGARAILLTGSASEADLHLAVRAGVSGVVYKTEPPEVVVRAIRSVHAGEVWLSRSLLTATLTQLREAHAAPNPEASKIAALTAREREIITLLTKGLSRNQIANRLCVSEGTARNHLSSVFSKLNLHNQISLVLYAQRHGLDKDQRPLI